ncbi:hypothetical protein F4859DRAFT_427096 [Xylaria cf. heliscus]|nr:hypothetical protein F4859DRAFT_427096 [Xylaria cf. heliscus]
MPRPPLSRPARSRPFKATNPNAAPAPAPAPAPDPQADAPSSDIYDVSDREKERAAERRKSLRDSTSTRNRAISAESIQQQKIMDKAKQRRDEAMERLENITSTDTSEKEAEEAADGSDGSPGPSQRVKETPLRRSRPTDLSGLDLDDSMFDDLNTTLDTAIPASAYRSAETSTLSVSQFRRRPRAGSFLSRDDGPIRPSSRTGPNTPAFSSTLNFGVFKRRAREPSILSTAQKPRPQRPEPEQELADNEDEDEDGDLEGPEEDGFAPEAESTPLRRSKRGSGGAEPTQPTSSTRSRKRKSTEGHEQRVRSSPFEASDEIRQSIEQPPSDEDSPLSSPSLPRHVPSTPIAPPMDPELMAPPLSSDSSESDEEIWPPLKSIPKARTRQAASALRQTPGQNDDVSDMSSPPSLTHSPNYAHSSSPPPTRAAKPKCKAAPKPPRKVTTADLTGLLPRRRRRGARGDPFGINEDESEPEVDISGLGDDDELAHLDVRTRRRPVSRVNAQNQAATKAHVSTRNKDKPTHGSNKRISRTYGRLSDKENSDQDEDEGQDDNNSPAESGEEDSQMLVERLGEELKTAVRKFQEVDKWELSFEERARSSSPLDAR